MMTVQEETETINRLWLGVCYILRSIRLLTGAKNDISFQTIDIEITVKFRGGQ